MCVKVLIFPISTNVFFFELNTFLFRDENQEESRIQRCKIIHFLSNASWCKICCAFVYCSDLLSFQIFYASGCESFPPTLAPCYAIARDSTWKLELHTHYMLRYNRAANDRLGEIFQGIPSIFRAKTVQIRAILLHRALILT